MSTLRRGGCGCGALGVEVTLTRPPHDHVPRACDCDYCRAHDAAWLSDPHGVLRLLPRTPAALAHQRQGSAQADFLLCAHCGTLVMVTCEIDGCLYGAVNARVLAAAGDFPPAEPASPQHLSGADKRARWQRLWFADVRLTP